jgi:hypothetical protein
METTCTNELLYRKEQERVFAYKRNQIDLALVTLNISVSTREALLKELGDIEYERSINFFHIEMLVVKKEPKLESYYI